MIYLLYGDNEFAKRQRLAQLLPAAGAERYEGDRLDMAGLRAIVQEQSLFAAERTVVITGLSENTTLWNAVPEVMADTTGVMVMLLETKLDKRTKTYKWLQKQAEVMECAMVAERDWPKVVAWCVARAKQAHGQTLSSGVARTIVERLGHDQLRIDQFLEQLALADGSITPKVIDQLLPLAKAESVFVLFEAALQGDAATVHRIIAYLEASSGDEGAYQTVGLLASQLMTLSGLVLGGSPASVATDLNVPPFAAKKLARCATTIDERRLGAMVEAVATADKQMKTTSVQPWLLVELAIMRMMP